MLLKTTLRTSLVVQWLRLRASKAKAVGSIPGWDTRMQHELSDWEKKKKEDRACKKKLPIFILTLFQIPNAGDLNVSSPLKFLFCSWDELMIMIHLSSHLPFLHPQLSVDCITWAGAGASDEAGLPGSACRWGHHVAVQVFLEGEWHVSTPMTVSIHAGLWAVRNTDPAV